MEEAAAFLKAHKEQKKSKKKSKGKGKDKKSKKKKSSKEHKDRRKGSSSTSDWSVSTTAFKTLRYKGVKLINEPHIFALD